MFRKIIRIKAEDSPNVARALEQKRRGQEPDRKRVCPGVLDYDDYLFRRATWDPVRQVIGLDALFYKGADQLMFPPHWLARAEEIASKLPYRDRVAEAIGIDPAEGGDKTAMTAIDRFGIIEQVSKKTPDTSVIVGEAIAFMTKWRCDPKNVCFDRGGGGKQRADDMRKMGYPVRTVGFGESVTPDPRRGMAPLSRRKDEREEKYAYVNKRAEMFGSIRELIDPALNPDGWGIPAACKDLRFQLAPIPLRYDGEGRLYLLPKNSKTEDGECLTKLIGRSPDEADSCAIAVHMMTNKEFKRRAGSLFH